MRRGLTQVSAAVDRLPRVFRALKARRIVLLTAILMLTTAAGASAATAIHFQPESASALKAQLHHHEVHALTIHPTPAPGHVHVSLNNGQHFTVVYTASEQAQLVALARADGTPVAVSVTKTKAAAKPVHHTLRYVAGGILVLVIIVVAAVLLLDRRRKLGEEGGGDTPPPTQSQPSQ
jgi:cell division protein ZapA (FtsZ GTPase activity inhibitor)